MVNIKLFIIILVIAIIVILSIFLVRFGHYYFDFMNPPGVGLINSDHVDFKFFIILDSQQLDFDIKKHLEPSRTNPYIFFGGDKWVHKVATGANLQMLLQSIGVEFNENCLILQSKFTDIFDNPLVQTQYCDEEETKLRMYENNLLKDQDIASYSPSQIVDLVLVYDNINDEKRNFTKYHHESVVTEHDD